MTVTGRNTQDSCHTCDNKTSILLQLKASIDMLSSRMSTFESTLETKISKLESNYVDLNGKIEKMKY
jgi:hypothetical protein